MTEIDGERHEIADPELQEPGLIDGIRFLYRRRVKLAFHSAAIFALGILGFSYSFLTSPKTVEGILGISFRGIEKSEYPNGKRFSVEDLRSPSVLMKALGQAGVSPQQVPLRDLAGRTYVIPIYPGDIQGRWKKQDQSGVRREEFFPNEFRIAVEVSGLNDMQRLRLFDAIINQYQESVKYEQRAAKGFVFSTKADYEQLAANYDLWDIPYLFRETYLTLSERLTTLINEATQFQDSSFQLAFREIAKELGNWERTRLQTLEALTYQGRLVRNKDFVLQRIQYRIQNLGIQVKQQSQEAKEAIGLLQVIDRPKTLVSGQLAKEGAPVIDGTALDRLLKGDYIGPVVERISKLQQDVQEKQEEKDRLEKQLALFPKSSSMAAGALPEGYRELINSLLRELNSIIQNHNRLLDDYLNATITTLVTIKQGPVVTRTGYSPILVIPGIAVMSLFLAIILLGMEHIFARARQEERHVPGQDPKPVARQAAGNRE